MFGEFAVLLGVMLLALALGMPVFLCLALSIITYGAVYWPKVPLEIVVQGFLQGIDNYGLVAIPFFFLVGEILNVEELAAVWSMSPLRWWATCAAA